MAAGRSPGSRGVPTRGPGSDEEAWASPPQGAQGSSGSVGAVPGREGGSSTAARARGMHCCSAGTAPARPRVGVGSDPAPLRGSPGAGRGPPVPPARRGKGSAAKSSPARRGLPSGRWRSGGSRPALPSPPPADDGQTRLCLLVPSWSGRRARDRDLCKMRAFLLREDPRVSQPVPRRRDRSRSARALPARSGSLVGSPPAAGWMDL